MKKLAKVVSAVTLIAVGFLTYLVLNESPESAFFRIQALANEQDWNGLYGQLSQETQDELDILAGISRQYMSQLSIPDASELSDADIFSFSMSGSSALHPLFFTGEYEVLEIERESNWATLQLRDIAKSTNKPATLIKESGLWKLDVRIE